MEIKEWNLDFPSRIRELKRRWSDDALACEREITFLLMCAWPVVLVPLERLELIGHAKAHPSKDILDARYSAIKAAYVDFGNQSAVKKLRGTHWHGEIALEHVENGSTRWATNLPPANSSDPKIAEIASTLRHALAHGNVFNWSSQDGGPIEKVCFGNLYRGKLTCWITDPEGLTDFLEKWIDFWAVKERVPTDMVNLVVPTRKNSQVMLVVQRCLQSVRRYIS